MPRPPTKKDRFQPLATDLRKSDARKKAIVDATIDCIAQNGVQELSAFAIGKRTKMRRSHIAYYFPNLDKMVEAAILQVVETGQRFTIAAMEKAHTPPDRLDA
jgi:DNA-binding transcriptional regulator YbjK